MDAIFARVFGPEARRVLTWRSSPPSRGSARSLVSLAVLLALLPGRARSSRTCSGRVIERVASARRHRRSTTAWWPRSSARSPTRCSWSGPGSAVHRLPVSARVDALHRRRALRLAACCSLALALLRGYGILLDWYATRSRACAARRDLAARVRPALRARWARSSSPSWPSSSLLQHFGVNVASLVVSLGVGSLAVGLAAQDTLANMFAGFTLMLDRPFRVGDRIQLATRRDRATCRRSACAPPSSRRADETILVVPNSLLVKERLVNLSRPTRHLATTRRGGGGLRQRPRAGEATCCAEAALRVAARGPRPRAGRSWSRGSATSAVHLRRDVLGARLRDQGLARSEVARGGPRRPGRGRHRDRPLPRGRRATAAGERAPGGIGRWPRHAST